MACVAVDIVTRSDARHSDRLVAGYYQLHLKTITADVLVSLWNKLNGK